MKLIFPLIRTSSTTRCTSVLADASCRDELCYYYYYYY